jgi:hypothetical protein
MFCDRVLVYLKRLRYVLPHEMTRSEKSPSSNRPEDGCYRHEVMRGRSFGRGPYVIELI